MHQLRLRHIDHSLMMRKHQPDKVHVIVAHGLKRGQRFMHRLHAVLQLKPGRATRYWL